MLYFSQTIREAASQSSDIVVNSNANTAPPARPPPPLLPTPAPVYNLNSRRTQPQVGVLPTIPPRTSLQITVPKNASFLCPMCRTKITTERVQTNR